VRVKNTSIKDSSPVKAYLESIVCDSDPSRKMELIDCPIPLYTQERLRESLSAKGGPKPPARPVLFRGDQPKWYEIFQVTEAPDPKLHVIIVKGREDITPLPLMMFKCKVYGWGAPLQFSVVYEEVGDEWQIKLITEKGEIIGPERPTRR
jgi:hypothetical protein